MLRFTNGIANRGAGHFRLRPDPFPEEAPSGTVTIDAFQEILAQPCTEPEECAQLVPVTEKLVSTFEFHPDHRHWHVAEAALFEVREARDDGQGGRWGAVVGAVSKKLGRHIGAIQYFSCHDHLTRATA